MLKQVAHMVSSVLERIKVKKLHNFLRFGDSRLTSGNNHSFYTTLCSEQLKVENIHARGDNEINETQYPNLIRFSSNTERIY
jgi:hypothetical protein